ncbi:hypothetical protein JL722_4039 [Aureococcus anophagefferens]|nr:hypothetical protein JL722_4039 [Aureococcus anophagefferens]
MVQAFRRRRWAARRARSWRSRRRPGRFGRGRAGARGRRAPVVDAPRAKLVARAAAESAANAALGFTQLSVKTACLRGDADQCATICGVEGFNVDALIEARRRSTGAPGSGRRPALAACGASLDATDGKGNRALHVACERGHPEAAEALLRLSASGSVAARAAKGACASRRRPSTRDRREMDRGQEAKAMGIVTESAMAMQAAAFNGDAARVRALLARGANVNALFKGRRPLHCAASCGDVDCVAALLEAEGVNVDGRCGEGFRSPCTTRCATAASTPRGSSSPGRDARTRPAATRAAPRELRGARGLRDAAQGRRRLDARRARARAPPEAARGAGGRAAAAAGPPGLRASTAEVEDDAGPATRYPSVVYVRAGEAATPPPRGFRRKEEVVEELEDVLSELSAATPKWDERKGSVARARSRGGDRGAKKAADPIWGASPGDAGDARIAAEEGQGRRPHLGPDPETPATPGSRPKKAKAADPIWGPTGDAGDAGSRPKKAKAVDPIWGPIRRRRRRRRRETRPKKAKAVDPIWGPIRDAGDAGDARNSAKKAKAVDPIWGPIRRRRRRRRRPGLGRRRRKPSTPSGARPETPATPATPDHAPRPRKAKQASSSPQKRARDRGTGHSGPKVPAPPDDEPDNPLFGRGPSLKDALRTSEPSPAKQSLPKAFQTVPVPPRTPDFSPVRVNVRTSNVSSLIAMLAEDGGERRRRRRGRRREDDYEDDEVAGRPGLPPPPRTPPTVAGVPMPSGFAGGF